MKKKKEKIKKSSTSWILETLYKSISFSEETIRIFSFDESARFFGGVEVEIVWIWSVLPDNKSLIKT